MKYTYFIFINFIKKWLDREIQFKYLLGICYVPGILGGTIKDKDD